jgi:hypothetical protein
MSTQTRGFPAGEMRASDADRDLALAELSEHFQTGRLTQEEFDDRTGRALQARTGQELTELFTDLPGPADPGGAASGGTDPAGLGGPAASAGRWGSADPSSSGPSWRDPSGSGQSWQSPSGTGPSSWPARSPIGRSPSCRRPVPFVIVGVIAAIVVANLLGHLAHVTIGPVGIGFGWVIPVFIIVFIVRRLARNR